MFALWFRAGQFTPEQLRIFFTIVGLVAAMVLFLVVRAFLVKRRRDGMMPQAAMAAGFSYDGDIEPFSGSDAILTADLFTSGTSAEFAHVMRGSAGGLSVTVFDYSFRMAGDRNQRSLPQTVAVFRLSERELPRFQLKPENFVAKLEAKLGKRDINFDSNPVFSQKFTLRGEDEEGVRKLFTSDVLAYFEGADWKPWQVVEGCGNSVLIYRMGRLVEPEELRMWVDEMAQPVTMLRDKSRATFGV